MIRSAQRDVIARAVVALALIMSILVLAFASVANAEPAPGRGITHTPAIHTPHLGAGRPAGCPRLWCGCWARLQVGIKDPAYNLALHWLRLRHVHKQVGAWAVMRRRGGGHVGRVVQIDANGNPIVLSGNHGHRVGVGVVRAGRVVAYVVPR